LSDLRAQKSPDWPPPCLWRSCTCAVGVSHGEDGAGAGSGSSEPADGRKPADCVKPYPECQICGPAVDVPAGVEVNHPLTHRVYDSFESACQVRDAWDALAAAAGDLFSSFDWCALWWRRYGTNRRLEIHAFTRNDRLVGIFPLFRERLQAWPLAVRTVRVVGCDHSTATCNLLVHPGVAEEVLTALFQSVTADGPWDLIHIGRLPGYFQHTAVLKRVLRDLRGVRNVATIRDPHPHTLVDLPKTYDEYLQGLSSRERQNIRKEHRRLAREHQLSSRDLAADAAAVAAIRQFMEFHKAQWTQKGQHGHFKDWPGSEEFHQDIAYVESHTRRLSLQEVSADGQFLSMAYALRFGRRMHFFLAARSMDPKWHFCFPGRVGSCNLVKLAIDEGLSQVEMGIGYYPYKMKLGGRLSPVLNFAAMRGGAWPAFKIWTLRSAALLHDLLGYRLFYHHMAPRLPFANIRLHRWWIRSRLWPDDARDFLRRFLMAVVWLPWLLTRLRGLFRHADGSRKEAHVLAPMSGLGEDRQAAFSEDSDSQSGALNVRRQDEFRAQRYQFFCELGEAELQALRRQGGKWLELATARRLDRGEELCMIWFGDRPAAMFWPSRHDEDAAQTAPEFGCKSPVYPHVVFRGFNSGVIADLIKQSDLPIRTGAPT
jgi:CelD/BcsL family acetyltransferase involved in cellulose biosynthesis